MDFLEKYIDMPDIEYWRISGGGSTYPLHLINALTDIDHSNEYTMFCPGFTKNEVQIKDNLTLKMWHAFFKKPFSYADPLPFFNPRIFKEFDIVHIYQSKKISSFLATVATKMNRKPVFLTYLGGGGLSPNYDLLIDRYLLLSKYSIKELGIENRKADVIYGGINLDDFKVSSTDVSDLKAELAPNGEILLLYSGQIRAHKKIDQILYAFKTLSKRNESIKLIIMGGVMEPEYYKKLTSEIPDKLKTKIVFTGYIAMDKLAPYYLASDIFVFPSSHELLGLVLLEAMAAEKPVVAAKTTAIPEVVEDGITGFLVPAISWMENRERSGITDMDDFCKKLEMLIENPTLRKKMGMAGRKRVEMYFTWEKVARNCLECYKNEIHKTKTKVGKNILNKML